MIDITAHLDAVHRRFTTGPLGAGEGRSIVLRRIYDAPIEDVWDVWDVCTDPDRLRRWFLPVSGDFRVGGAYQIEGNAGGEILRCEPPRLLRVTWVYQDLRGPEVEVRLSPTATGETVLELEHVAPAEMVDRLLGEVGPGGTIGIGLGWDLTLFGLARFFQGDLIEDPAARMESLRTPEGRELLAGSSRAWGAVLEAAGVAAGPEIAAAVEAVVSHSG
jgi:uncharacterized protein YndB with AHSA1/START domain